MAELKRLVPEGREAQSGELKELIDHWIQVIDSWVEDPAPRPAPESPPVGGAG